MDPKVKVSARARRGRKRDAPSPVSAKHQVTLPVDVLREAGIAAGDLVWISSEGPGAIRISAGGHSAWDDAIGSLTGTWNGFDVRAERDTWSR